jgi:hypothetical protein
MPQFQMRRSYLARIYGHPRIGSGFAQEGYLCQEMKAICINISITPVLLLIFLNIAYATSGNFQTSDNSGQFNTVRGLVTDEQDYPLSEYVVEAISLSDEVSFNTKTNHNGQFSLVNLRFGTWLLRVSYYSTLLTQREIMVSSATTASAVDFVIEGTGNISGLLLDSKSQLPLPIDGEVNLGLRTREGKQVQKLFRGQVSSGCFEVKNLLPGQYIVIDAFKKYVFDMPASPVMMIYPGSHIGGVEIFLKPGATIRGRFIDEENRQPISDLVVRAASEKIQTIYPDRRFNHEAQTNAAGEFWLTTPNDPQQYSAFLIVTIDSRYQSKRFRWDFAPGKNEYDLGEIVMQRVLSLTGKVAKSTSDTVECLVVKLKMHNKSSSVFHASAATEARVETDSQGDFFFEGLYPIEYSLTVAQGNRTVAVVESVNPQKQDNVFVRLKKYHTLRGTVVNSQQQPLADVRIQATRRRQNPQGHETPLSTSKTDGNGHFQMQVLETDPKLLSVVVRKSGYFSRVYRNMSITSQPLLVSLEKGSAFKGRVLLPPNAPSDGHYAVKLFPANLPISPVMNPRMLQKPLLSEWFPVTQAAFLIDGIPEGKYTLYVVGEGIAATGVEVEAASNGTLGNDFCVVPEEIIVLADRPTVALQGSVLWADTGKPVIKALVSRSWYPWELNTFDFSMTLDRFETETDNQGRFTFPNLTQGRYLIRINYVDAVFERTSETYKRTLIHQEFEIPVCNESYRFYLGRRDGTSFVSATAHLN